MKKISRIWTILICYLFLCLPLISCSQFDNKTEKTSSLTIIENESQHRNNNQNKKSAKLSVTNETKKILITKYQQSKKYYDSKSSYVWETNNSQTILDFGALLDNHKVKQYSCYPTPFAYSINFYAHNDSLLKIYYVDTTMNKNIATVIQRSFQYRYEVPISDWRKITGLFQSAN